MDAEVRESAKILWDYLKLDQPLAPCDCIIALGSHDLRVAAHAAQLYLDGWAPWLVCSGGLGRLTRTLWQEPEAQKFARVALEAGVAKDRILIEDRSTNTGENIRFSRELLNHTGLQISSALLVHKPYMERRSLATALKLWPDIRYCVSSPNISIEDYPDQDVSLDQMIAIIVGDFQRILKYPARGYQIAQEVPPEAMQAYQKLVAFGYTNQMLIE